MNKSIIVGDYSFNDIVLDTAKQFSIEPESDKNEFCVRVPKEVGKGYIKTTEFDNGIGVVDYD
ncbi:hypothetical protein [Aquimarina agarivorans]|uniref:hypothetical protein n=1 Tax=Aquimarina agarivorans TaxID=980584 RepID=UPI000248EA35|nr:hypothetical protein [Aquimarina agarivorans]